MGPVLGILLVVALVVASFAWSMSRSRGILEEWAASNHFRILACERRWLRRGPFFLRSGKGHEVFHVTVADDSGRTRTGFVRVGGWFGGLLSDQAVVEWDD